MLEDAVLVDSEIDWRVGYMLSAQLLLHRLGASIPLNTATQGRTTGCIPYSIHAEISR